MLHQDNNSSNSPIEKKVQDAFTKKNQHQEYKVKAVDPLFLCKQIKPQNNFPIVCSSLVRNMNDSFDMFAKQIIDEINTWPEGTLLGIFPEYFLRLSLPEEVFNFIENKLAQTIPKNLTLVFGTLEFNLNFKFTNNAIIIHDGKIWFRPKTKILAGERKNGIEPGENMGIIRLPFFNLGVLVCADLWDEKLVKNLILQGADIIAVPAWTGTSDAETAREDWRALTRSTSTSKGVIVAVSDHLEAPQDSNYQVANATEIRSPDKRPNITSKDKIYRYISFANFSEVATSNSFWKQKGLAQSYQYKDQKKRSAVDDTFIHNKKIKK